MAIKSTKKRNLKSKKRNIKQQNFKIDIEPHVSREVYGIFYVVFAILFFLVLIWNAGKVWNILSPILSQIFWIWRWIIPFIFLWVSIAFFFAKQIMFNITRTIGLFLIVGSLLGLIHVSAPLKESFIEAVSYGGYVGFASSIIFKMYLGNFATVIILLGLFLVSILFIFNTSFKDIIDYFKGVEDVETSIKWNNNIILSQVRDDNNIEDAEIKIIKPNKKEEAETNKEVKQIPSPKIQIKKPAKKDLLEITNIQVSKNWKFPGMDLLVDQIDENYPEDNKLKEQAINIKNKLSQFGVDVEMVWAQVWPTVTQFTLSPQSWIPVKKIVNAKHDLAMALSAKSIRIEAPIPWQPYVGLEIPNQSRSTVYMKEILESEEFSAINSSLRLTVGKDVAGNPMVVDLAKMPHLLIAGATGSGKSVGMNSFIVSLLYQNSPDDLKFIMIDPKRVELTPYNGIPHLLTPVITNADKALASLKWSVSEMMRRYEECAQKGYRNIEEYNEEEDQKMPKIIIIIDELADLMMRDLRKDTEAAIMRIAQMARAVWMHLIIATQRPSVDVITGVIKANIPTRMSFSVMSAVDSRTIIDSIWAEELLWMGDMLFVDSNTPKPKRVQSIYISTKEIEKITNFLKLTIQPSDNPKIDITKEEKEWVHQTTSINLDNFAQEDQEDDLVPKALEVIMQSQKASATYLQRSLSIGYARAAKILDILEKKWAIGPSNGAKPREIYIEKGE